jgi:hypothetical protein
VSHPFCCQLADQELEEGLTLVGAHSLSMRWTRSKV